MKKLFLYVFVGALLAVSVFAAEKSDFVQLVENTDYCFDCHTIYKITKASDDLLSKFAVDFNNADGEYVFPEFEVSILTSQDYTELVDLYEPCIENQVIINNDTGDEETVEVETSCYKETEEVFKTRTEYVPVSSFNSLKEMYNSAEIGSEYYIKVSGKLKPGESLDNILVLNDYTYDEYAWWSGSFFYRINISCVNVSEGTPIVINGSKGLKIGNYTQFIWTNCQKNGSLAVYYNNYSSYIVANDTGQVPFDVELGNETDYLPSPVFNQSYYRGVWHFGTSGLAEDSSSYGKNGSISSASWVGNGTIGGAYKFNGVSANISVGNVLGTSPTSKGTLMAFVVSFSNGTGTTYDTLRPIIADTGYAWYTMGVNNVGGITQIKYDNASTPQTYSSNSSIISSEWNLIISTWDNTSTQRIYINNNQVYNATGHVLYSESNTSFGEACDSGLLLNGYLDEIRILNMSLNSTQISEFYNNYLGTVGYGSAGNSESYGSYIGPSNESFGREAIIAGITTSEIGSFYTAYSDKQVYIRLANGSQYKGTFDEFVASGNKRWAFNYDQNTSSSFPTFFNITPVFYVWQRYNLTFDQIKNNVTDFIDSTN